MTSPTPVSASLRLGAIVVIAALPALGVYQSMGTKPGLAALIALLSLTIWATGWLPEVLGALLFFALATLTAIVPPATVFSGFASSAFWLVLSGMTVGAAITRTGLGGRIARTLIRPLSASYPRLIAGVLAMTYGLAFVMPSNIGRIVLLMPICLAMADQLGLPPGRKGRIGVALAVGFGTFILSTTILPANVPNQVMAGAIEHLYHLHFDYLPYLILHAPVMGILRGILLCVAICVLFPDTLDVKPAETGTAAPPPMSPAEIRLAILLLVTLGFWATDALHGISPAWIGLAAAVVCLLPGIGMVPIESFNQTNFRTMFYIVALLGVVAMIAETGLGVGLSHAMLAILPLSPDAPAGNFGILSGLSLVLAMLLTANGGPAVFTSMAADMAQVSGLALPVVLMTQVIGFSTVVLPYQATPIVVAADLGGVSLKDAAKLTLGSGLATIVILWPIDFLWWRVLGWI